MMRSMSAISSLITSWKRRRSAHVSALKPLPTPCGTSSRNDGSRRKRPMNSRTLSAYTIFLWNSSSVAHSPTMSPIFSLMMSPKKSSSRKSSIGTSCWSKSPTRDWVMEGSVAWRPASSIQWPRCRSRRWVMAFATNTGCSSRLFRTAGNAKSRTTGFVTQTPGRLVDHTRR